MEKLPSAVLNRYTAHMRNKSLTKILMISCTSLYFVTLLYVLKAGSADECSFVSEWTVDWVTVRHQPSRSSQPRCIAVWKWVSGYVHEAVSGTDTHTLGQLPSCTVAVPTSGVQLHVGHQGFHRLYSSSESDCSEGRRSYHTGRACMLTDC